MIEVPKRPSSMSINLPGGARMLSRQARPLNGIEIKQALVVMINQLAVELLERGAVGWMGEERDKCIESLVDQAKARFDLEWALNKSHVCYPGVGWSIQVNLEKWDGEKAGFHLNSKVTLDLALNVRSEYIIGFPGCGPTIDSLEHEQLNTNVPDRMRQNSGLPVEVDFIRQDGTTGKTQIKMARTVEIGSGKSPVRIDNEEVKVIQVISQPENLPELPAEDLIADSPKVEDVQPTRPNVYVQKPRAEVKKGK